MKVNTVTVSPAISLETGDIIAKGLASSVICGKITGMATYRYQLTEDQVSYMRENHLNVPDEPLAHLDTEGSFLIFGDFEGVGILCGQPNHMYLRFDDLVAVFPRKQ